MNTKNFDYLCHKLFEMRLTSEDVISKLSYTTVHLLLEDKEAEPSRKKFKVEEKQD